MENDAEQILKEVRDDLSVYVELRLRMLKLTVIEKTARVLTVLSFGLILLLFVFFTILFLFMALGFFLGDLLDSVALGFLFVGGLYLVLAACFLFARYRIRLMIMNLIIKSFQIHDNEKEI